MRRHDLAYVRPGTRFRFHCGASDPALAQRVTEWLESGRPLVVARQTGGSDDVLLGLTLPAREGRRRIRCVVERRDVIRVTAPLAVTRCVQRLQPHIATPLVALAARLAAEGVQVGVYGSLAWEALSEEAYRHEASDVDLICDVSSQAQTEIALSALGATAGDLRCGLDGEIRFPDGRAVAWKELANAWSAPDSPVLAKGTDEVALVPLAQLLDQFQEIAAHA